MNQAHLHLVVNHFPIIGTIFGFGIILTGIVKKNKTLLNTAYILFVISAVTAAVSMATGEGAEEMVEDMADVGHKIIHNHEEMAEKLAVVLYALGLVSLAGLYLNAKNNAKATLLAYLAATISVVGIVLGKETGTTGGEVRHTEIRTGTTGNAAATDSDSESHEESEENH